ncbi:MAG: hypothetical protein JNK63_00140 [Chthonomonas sp.]|nr:hypothetical protein [Chthonomonas sp.]
MSITSTRNFIEKSGCGVITGVLLAAIMGLSMASGQCKNAPGAQANPNEAPAVVTIGDTKLTGAAIDAIAKDDLANRERQVLAQLQGKPFDGYNSLQKGQFFRDSLGSAVDGGVNIQMAKEAGIKLEDSVLLDKFMNEVTTQISQFRQQMTQSGQLPANATEEQYLAKFREATGGKTPDQLISENRTMLADRLKDPNLSVPLKGQGAQMLWIEKEESLTQVSDAELDTIFDTVNLKAIVLNQAPRQNRFPDAERILAEIKSGKITFEAAMDKYSEKPLPKDKTKKSDVTDMLAYQFLLTDPNYGVVKTLKPGEISAVIKGVDGPIIYKMINVKKDNKPADFATNKEFYRTNHKKFMANTKFFRLQREAREKLPKFGDEGLNLLYQCYLLERDPILEQDHLKIVEGAAKLSTNGPAVIARLLSGNRVWRGLQGENKSKFEDAHYMPALENFLNAFGPNPALNLTLVDMFASRKSAKAGEQLLAASISNTSLSDMGKAMFDRITSKFKDLKAAGLVKPEVSAQIQANLDRWSKDKKQRDDQAKEMAAKEAADRAKNEAAMKAEKEAAKTKTPSRPDSKSLLEPR